MNRQGIAMSPELLNAVRKRDRIESRRRNEILIWPDMAPGVITFFAMGTQWQRHPMGPATGLDYSAILPTAKMLGLEDDFSPEAFHDIRIMEGEALKALRSRRK